MENDNKIVKYKGYIRKSAINILAWLENNPNPTQADRIAGATMKHGGKHGGKMKKMMHGGKMSKMKKMMYGGKVKKAPGGMKMDKYGHGGMYRQLD